MNIKVTAYAMTYLQDNICYDMYDTEVQDIFKRILNENNILLPYFIELTLSCLSYTYQIHYN